MAEYSVGLTMQRLLDQIPLEATFFYWMEFFQKPFDANSGKNLKCYPNVMAEYDFNEISFMTI